MRLPLIYAVIVYLIVHNLPAARILQGWPLARVIESRFTKVNARVAWLFALADNALRTLPPAAHARTPTILGVRA